MRTDKKFRDIVFYGWVTIGMILLVLFTIPNPNTTMSNEEIQLVLGLFFGLVIFFICASVGAYYSEMLRREDRKKGGLREKWVAEDLDELEERVRKLEEAKK